MLLKLEQSIFQLCNLIGRSSGNADVCCLTEQLGRHFWHVKKTSSSSDAQPPYLAPLSLAWRQAHIISSTWDRKPWGAAAGSGDYYFFFCCSGSWSLYLNRCCNRVPPSIQPGSKCEKPGFEGGRRRGMGEMPWGSGCDISLGWGTLHHGSSAWLGHSCLLLSEDEQMNKGMEFRVHLSPSCLRLPGPISTPITSS